jgi:hypothetical protein
MRANLEKMGELRLKTYGFYILIFREKNKPRLLNRGLCDNFMDSRLGRE